MLGSMPKTYAHFLSTSGKYMAGFLVKSFGGYCGSKVLTGASCWPSSDCILAHICVGGAWHSNLTNIPLIYSVSYFNLGGLGALFGGDKPTNAAPVATGLLHTTVRGPNPTCEALSPGGKTHLANNVELIYLRKICWFSTGVSNSFQFQGHFRHI